MQSPMVSVRLPVCHSVAYLRKGWADLAEILTQQYTYGADVQRSFWLNSALPFRTLGLITVILGVILNFYRFSTFLPITPEHADGFGWKLLCIVRVIVPTYTPSLGEIGEKKFCRRIRHNTCRYGPILKFCGITDRKVSRF